jgi:hypothetical protein
VKVPPVSMAMRKRYSAFRGPLRSSSVVVWSS